MYIYGSFLTQQNAAVTVYIVTDNDRTQEIEISPDSTSLAFPAESPVTISSEVNDTFDHLLCQSATIRLLARDYIADFFRTSARDAVVNIYKDGVCLFAGFIEPQSYSQPYNEVWDEIEINCIDALSALQYGKYRGIGGPSVFYDEVKESAQQRTFYAIATEILNGITASIDIVGGNTVRYLYDGSKALDSASGNHYSIFRQLSLTELLFLGDTEDDVWSQDVVLEEILRYLNLHIIQDGFTFYIFDWATIKGTAPTISWRNLVNGQIATTSRNTITITNDNVADCDTQINVGEVYNKLVLTDKVVETSTVIDSPLDDDLLISPYANKQLYMTEYSADGEGRSAYNAFKAMCHEQNTDYGGGRITDWYIQIMNNVAWKFPAAGYENIIDAFCAQGLNQQALANWLASNQGAAIISMGCVDKNTAKNDNSPVSQVNMTNYLVVSVNGNGVDNDENNTRPSVADLKAGIPNAVYLGSAAGGTFSPADDATTNYIVLSGKVILNPIMEMTDTYKNLHNADDDGWEHGTWIEVPNTTSGSMFDTHGYWRPTWWHQTVPSRDNDDGRYYTRKYLRATQPTDTPAWDSTVDNGVMPFTGKGPEQYEFNYSAIGDSTDTISKIAVLSCMLIIGDKCVVETGTRGQVSDFEWRTYKTLEQCASEDEYYQQSFTIGFDPKIGDKLIGTEFSLQNNIDYTMGIDATGIAIPVRKSDRISGQVRFMILGPVNSTWDVITRRHPTFFRHTSWSSSSIPLLAHVSDILVKEFEVKVYSDNGGINNTDKDNDIVYMSYTREEYTNAKDDLEFKITTMLTAAECQELNVVNSVKQSTPLNVSTGDGLLSIYDYTKTAQAKPEKLYVDSYYQEYHLPRLIVEQNVIDTVLNVGLFDHYIHPALNKEFFVQGISRNLIEASAALKLKEIG
jgi:hypothetical protein